MVIIEELNLRQITEDFYSFKLYKEKGSVILVFDNAKIIFNSYLIFKCGYPNEEIYLHSDLYFDNSLNKYFLYEIQDSEWVKELIQMNRVHPRHTDESFKNDRHFLIYFEDETFECIANSYEIVSDK